MPRYAIYALYTASKHLGEVVADDKDDAISKAEDSDEVWVNICHQCSREIDLGDAYEFQAEEIPEGTTQ